MLLTLIKYLPILLLSLMTTAHAAESAAVSYSGSHCEKVPKRFSSIQNLTKNQLNPKPKASRENMVWIPAGTYMMGGDNEQARRDELPKHKVKVKGFWMDKTEVTNKQFAAFIKASAYVTTAEIKPDWNELKKQLPPGTAKPPDSQLVPASLVFVQIKHAVNLNNHSQGWRWQAQANWRQPKGPNSSIKSKNNHPVVHVSWFDANAYCKFYNKRLPTEAQWEWAARGNLNNKIYPWGNEPIDSGKVKANTWQGQFPYKNQLRDKYFSTAPVKSYPSNAYGLYDMAGNVWEWTRDWYDASYYQQQAATLSDNPQGPEKSFDPRAPHTPQKSIRGGSYLCNESYCSGYRVAARMKSSPDTSLEHTGFRCVAD